MIFSTCFCHKMQSLGWRKGFSRAILLLNVPSRPQCTVIVRLFVHQRHTISNKASPISSRAISSFFRRRKWPYAKPIRIVFEREHRINITCFAVGFCIIMVGLCFAAIPLYRMLCESSGLGGTTKVATDFERIEKMEKIKHRLIRVQFNADVPSSMQWKFKPAQNEIYVHPGETALAFFTAYNPTNKPIIGISSYNVTPFQAAYYFNKIQCFCFDEQILNPGEEVDLPVFFFIDPDFVNDLELESMDDLMLSYTFFESKTGLQLPSPFDPKNRPLNQNQKLILDSAASPL